jgi:hypothetical protein
VPWSQWVDVQSLLLPQGLPLAHVIEQLGGWHRPAEHTMEAQSSFEPHAFPLLHVGAQPGA